MAITGTYIKNEARKILLDPDPGDTWGDSDLLALINDGTRVLCTLRPDLFQVTGNISMVAGSEQALPAGGRVLMDLIKNVGGLGRSCTLVDRDVLDATERYAAGATPEAEVRDYAIDPRSPERFTVSPPNNGTGVVLARYCADPTPLTALTQNIVLADHFAQALIRQVVSLAYLADTLRQDLGKSKTHGDAAAQAIGVNLTSRTSLVPARRA